MDIPLFFHSALFRRPSPFPGADQDRDRLVKCPPVAHREVPETPVSTLDGVHDAEAPRAVLPEPLQFPPEGLTKGGIAPESLEGTRDRALQIGRKLPNESPPWGMPRR